MDHPGLPSTDDPFELLGLDRAAADDRAIRRAYARLIKLYRPERAPDEFARVHEAFERARFLVSAGIVAPPARPDDEIAAVVGEARDPGPPPGPAPIADDGARRRALDALARSVERDDRDGAEAAWRAARADGLRAEELLLAAGGETARWLVAHVAWTWAELGRWHDADAAHQVWLGAFAARLERDDVAGALAMASEDALGEDARTDPAVASLAVRAISALAWRAGEARGLLERYQRVPMHPLLERMLDRAQLDVEAGGLYLARNRPTLGPGVLPFVAELPVADDARRSAIVERLRTELRGPDELLASFDALGRRYPALAEALTYRLLDSVPHHRRELATLTPPAREHLGERLIELSGHTPWVLLALVGVVAVAVGIAVGLLAGAIEVGGMAGGTALLLWVPADRRVYARTVRRPLVRLLVLAGVTRACAREWLSTFATRALRLARFSSNMARDDGLRLIGMVAAAVARDDDEDDDVVSTGR